MSELLRLQLNLQRGLSELKKNLLMCASFKVRARHRSKSTAISRPEKKDWGRRPRVIRGEKKKEDAKR